MQAKKKQRKRERNIQLAREEAKGGERKIGVEKERQEREGLEKGR